MIISSMLCLVEYIDGKVYYKSLLFLVLSNITIYHLSMLTMTNQQAMIALLITAFFMSISIKAKQQAMQRRKRKALYLALSVLLLSVLLFVVKRQLWAINSIHLLLYSGLSYHVFLIYSIIHRMQQIHYKR